MKICFAASSGGHLEEIAQLKEFADQYDSFLVTEKSDFQNSRMCRKKYTVRKSDRKEKWFLFHYLALFIRSFFIIRKEKPDLVITTGALVTYPFCVWAKLRKSKIIYIESYARVTTPSVTGKYMKRIADLFIVQSEELLKYYPNAVYGGCIF